MSSTNSDLEQKAKAKTKQQSGEMYRSKNYQKLENTLVWRSNSLHLKIIQEQFHLITDLIRFSLARCGSGGDDRDYHEILPHT